MLHNRKKKSKGKGGDSDNRVRWKKNLFFNFLKKREGSMEVCMVNKTGGWNSFYLISVFIHELYSSTLRCRSY